MDLWGVAVVTTFEYHEQYYYVRLKLVKGAN